MGTQIIPSGKVVNITLVLVTTFFPFLGVETNVKLLSINYLGRHETDLFVIPVIFFQSSLINSCTLKAKFGISFNTKDPKPILSNTIITNEGNLIGYPSTTLFSYDHNEEASLPKDFTYYYLGVSYKLFKLGTHNVLGTLSYQSGAKVTINRTLVGARVITYGTPINFYQQMPQDKKDANLIRETVSYSQIMLDLSINFDFN
jgi:hypothetical protein